MQAKSFKKTVRGAPKRFVHTVRIVFLLGFCCSNWYSFGRKDIQSKITVCRMMSSQWTACTHKQKRAFRPRQKTSYEQTVKHRSDFLNLGRKLVSLTCCPASFAVHLLNWQNKDRVLDWRKRQNICDCCGILRPLCISTHAAKSARVKTVEGVVMSTSEGASRNNETYWRQASSAVLRYTEPCESRCALCALRYGWGQKICDLRATKFMGAP